MKIICEKIIHFSTKKELEKSPWLSIGKEYIVLAKRWDKGSIEIIIQSDHDREPIMKSLDGFKVLSNYQPTSWVKWKISDNRYWLLPKSWKYDSFFDDVENAIEPEDDAIKLFNKEAQQIYSEEEAYEKIIK